MTSLPRKGTLSSSNLERLERLAALRDKDILTQEEFEGQKAIILGGEADTPMRNMEHPEPENRVPPSPPPSPMTSPLSADGTEKSINRPNSTTFIITLLCIFLVFIAAGVFLNSRSTEPSPTSPPEPGWIADKITGCKIWNPDPRPNESVTWSGPCVAGEIFGQGVEQWYENGSLGNRIEGILKDNRWQGNVTVTYPNGQKFVGTLSDNGKRNEGILYSPDGSFLRRISSGQERDALPYERPVSTTSTVAKPIGYVSVYASDLGAAGLVVEGSSQASVDRMAEDHCRALASDSDRDSCKKLTGGQSICVAFARSPDGAIGASGGDTASRARRDAIKACNEYAIPGSACTIPADGVMC
jgi:hypothetical protein